LARVLSSDDPKGLWKGYQGEIGDFRKIKLQNPNPFLGQPERVMERIQWEETPRLGVSEGIRLRIGPSPFLGRPERVMERIPRRDWRFRMIKLQEDKVSGRQIFRKIKLLQRKVKLSDLTTHLEQLSLWL
jgi:hypothetical protein